MADVCCESISCVWQVVKKGSSYIHGGAWRDPTVDSQSFKPAVTHLWNSSLKDQIAGFASINYRLSPYPSHPENPSSPEDPSRNARYPDHLLDVGQALLYLERKYSISNRYVLTGHSAGATMAYELQDWYFQGSNLPLPAAVVGVSGIYHFKAFIEAHSHPAYLEFMQNAFPDEALWERASPYLSNLPGRALWKDVKAIIISHSDEDELVEKGQAMFMLERARKDSHTQEKVHFLEASGAHDEIWASGHILAGILVKSMKLLQGTTAQL
jgi:kynurenine formamidase